MPVFDPDALFSPRSAIRADRYDWLSGRKELIGEIVKSAAFDSSSLVLYGERGVGKTSVAAQVFATLRREHEHLSLDELCPYKSGKKYSCAWIECTDDTSDISALLSRILAPIEQPNSFAQTFSWVYNSKEFLGKVEDEFGVNLKVLQATRREEKLSISGLVARTINEVASDKSKVRMLFDYVLAFIKSKCPDRDIVIFVDEADRIANPKGLGSIVKTSTNARFVIVGVADSSSHLVDDHASSLRKIVPVEIPALDEGSIRWIFKRVEISTRGTIYFDESFLNIATKYSGGFPWIAQRIGHDAVSKFYSKHRDGETAEGVSGVQAKEAVGNLLKHLSIAKTINKSLSGIIENNRTREEILWHLCNVAEWVSAKEIQNSIPRNLRRYTVDQLDVLAEETVIKRRKEDNRYRLDQSIYAIVLYHYISDLREERQCC